MAFLYAEVDQDAGYTTWVNPVTQQPTRIDIIGIVYDDAVFVMVPDDAGQLVQQLQPLRASVHIEGEELASLPPVNPDPAIADTPADPRFQAIMGVVIQRLAVIHKNWIAQVLKPVPVAKTPEQLAVLPRITPDMLPQV